MIDGGLHNLGVKQQMKYYAGCAFAYTNHHSASSPGYY